MKLVLHFRKAIIVDSIWDSILLKQLTMVLETGYKSYASLEAVNVHKKLEFPSKVTKKLLIT